MNGTRKKYSEYFKKQHNFFRGDSHHVVPISRGGNKNGKNKVVINVDLHRKYHDLFVNRTPEEVLDFLVVYFWGGDISFVEDYLMKEASLKKGLN